MPGRRAGCFFFLVVLGLCFSAFHDSSVDAFMRSPLPLKYRTVKTALTPISASILRRTPVGGISDFLPLRSMGRSGGMSLEAFREAYERLVWGDVLPKDEESGKNADRVSKETKTTNATTQPEGESKDTLDTSFGEISDDDMEFINTYVLNDEHAQQLSKKVAAAMEEEWDRREGVMGTPSVRRKPMPLKANIDLWSYQARKELLKSNFSGSEHWYSKCIDYNPCDGRPWLGLARIYWKRGNPQLSGKCYKEGLYYNPNNPYLLQSWAVMMVKQGKQREAMALLTTSVKKNPNHAASWVEMGRIHQKNSDISSARYCFSQAVDNDSRSYVALQVWGVLEADVGNVAKARDLFHRAIKLSPNSIHSLQALANLEKREGNFEGAQRLLEKAIFLFPGATRAMVTLADVFELQNDEKAARAIFTRGQNYAQRCGDAGFFQAWALFELRNSHITSRGVDKSEEEDAEAVRNGVEVVRRLFKRAVDCNKYHSASWVAWAKFEQKTGNPEIARKLLIAGISKFPNSKNIGWFHSSLGHLSRQSGDINTARSCYVRAMEVTPLYKGIPVLLEFVRMETYHGELRQAKDLLELAIKRYPGDDRVWMAYEEYIRRDAASGPLKGKFNSDDSYDAHIYAEKAIAGLKARRLALKKSNEPRTMIVEQRPY